MFKDIERSFDLIFAQNILNNNVDLSELKISLNKMSDLLSKHLLDTGFSSHALNITDNDVTLFGFARICKGDKARKIPHWEFNTSATHATNWTEFDGVPVWKFYTDTTELKMTESDRSVCQELMQSVYACDVRSFAEHVKAIITKALILNFNRDYTPDHLGEHQIDRDFLKAITKQKLDYFINTWLEMDTYFKQRITALASIVVSHIKVNRYFNKELQLFSDLCTNSGFCGYTVLNLSLTMEQLNTTLEIAENDVYSAIMYANFGIENIKTLFAQGFDHDKLLQIIHDLSPMEFKTLTSNFFFASVMRKEKNELASMVFSLSVMFGIELVANHFDLIKMVLKAQPNKGIERLIHVFKLLATPYSHNKLVHYTMVNFLVNSQPSKFNKDCFTTDLSNFNQIIESYTPVMLNSLAKKYELEQFIKKGCFPTLFKLTPQSTIFTKGIFDGVEIKGATFKLVAGSHDFLKLCEAMEMNLNFLNVQIKLNQKFVFRIDFKGKVYAVSFNMFDGYCLKRNTTDIALPNITELHEAVAEFAHKLTTKRMYIQQNYRFDYV